MNCPGHCLIFNHQDRSYRELPLRFADFGVLHRNESSGALTGLTRVRKFCQDDAHIFCMQDQVSSEIKSCLEFMKFVYDLFGFTFDLELSTRPDHYIGHIDVWNKAENSLKLALDDFGAPWKINPGDGAFYGPKIDIHLKDAFGKSHQCATIQLDFNLPQNFKLKYRDNTDNYQVPVMIHRAIFGSMERFIAVLSEHNSGKWPLWLSPKQVVVCSVSKHYNEYASLIYEQLIDEGFDTELNISDDTLSKKILWAQSQSFNYIVIVGQKELNSKTVSVRLRDQSTSKSVSMVELLNELHTAQKLKL